MSEKPRQNSQSGLDVKYGTHQVALIELEKNLARRRQNLMDTRHHKLLFEIIERVKDCSVTLYFQENIPICHNGIYWTYDKLPKMLQQSFKHLALNHLHVEQEKTVLVLESLPLWYHFVMYSERLFMSTVNDKRFDHPINPCPCCLDIDHLKDDIVPAFILLDFLCKNVFAYTVHPITKVSYDYFYIRPSVFERTKKGVRYTAVHCGASHSPPIVYWFKEDRPFIVHSTVIAPVRGHEVVRDYVRNLNFPPIAGNRSNYLRHPRTLKHVVDAEFMHVLKHRKDPRQQLLKMAVHRDLAQSFTQRLRVGDRSSAWAHELGHFDLTQSDVVSATISDEVAQCEGTLVWSILSDHLFEKFTMGEFFQRKYHNIMCSDQHSWKDCEYHPDNIKVFGSPCCKSNNMVRVERHGCQVRYYCTKCCPGIGRPYQQVLDLRFAIFDFGDIAESIEKALSSELGVSAKKVASILVLLFNCYRARSDPILVVGVITQFFLSSTFEFPKSEISEIVYTLCDDRTADIQPAAAPIANQEGPREGLSRAIFALFSMGLLGFIPKLTGLDIRSISGVASFSNLMSGTLASIHEYLTSDQVSGVPDAWTEWVQHVDDHMSKPPDDHRKRFTACITLIEVGQNLRRDVIFKMPAIEAAFQREMSRLYSEKSYLENMGIIHMPREEPTCIYLYGEPGVGKSYAMYPLLADILVDEDEYDPDKIFENVYCRNIEQEFWDGYHGQAVVWYDDFGQMRDSAAKPNKEFIEVIRTINAIPLILHSASLALKGRLAFTSKVVMFSANSRTYYIPSLTEPDAFYRRLNIVAEVVLDPQYQLANGRFNPAAATEPITLDAYRFNIKDEGGTTTQTLNYRQFSDMVRAQIRAQHTSSDARIQWIKNYAKTRYDIAHPDAEGWFTADPVDLMREYKTALVALTSVVAALVSVKFIWDLFSSKAEQPKESAEEDGEVYDTESIKPSRKNQQPQVESIKPNRKSQQPQVESIKPASKTKQPVIEGDFVYGPNFVPHKVLVKRSPLIFNTERDDSGFSEVDWCPSYGNANPADYTCPGCFRVVLKFCEDGKCLACNDIECPDWYFHRVICKYPDCALHSKMECSSETSSVAVIREDLDTLLSETSVEDALVRCKCGLHVRKVWSKQCLCCMGFARSHVPDWYFDNTVHELPLIDGFWCPYLFLGSRPERDPSKAACVLCRRIPRDLVGDCCKNCVSGEPVEYHSECEHCRVAKPEGLISMNVKDIITYKVVQNLIHIECRGSLGTMCAIKGRVTLWPKHVWATLVERASRTDGFFTVRQHRALHGHRVNISSCTVRPLKDKFDEPTDAVLVVLPRSLRQFADITHFFINKFDLPTKQVFDSLLVTARSNQVGNTAIDHLWVKCFKSEAADKIVTSPPGQPRYQMTVRDTFKYFGAETDYGDCGALLFALDNTSSRSLCGMHIAGTTGYGWSVRITVDMIENALRDVEQQAQISVPDFGVCKPPPFRPQGAFAVLGAIEGREPRGRQIHQPSAIHGDITPPTTAPFPDTLIEVDGVKILPLLEQCRKMGVPAPPLNPEISEEVKKAMVYHFNKGENHKRTLTIDEAVFGIEGKSEYPRLEPNTSPGYPWTKSRGPHKGKTKWIDYDARVVGDELREAVNKRIHNAEQGLRTPTIWKDCLKMERRELAKIAIGKGRLFSGAPMDYNICLKMYFGEFLASTIRNRITNGCCVGINPYTDWWALAKELTRKSKKVTAGDFSNMDGSEGGDLLWYVFDVINEWYNDENELVRFVLWCEIVNAIHMIFGVLYAAAMGNPSGNFLTGVINMLVILFILLYIYRVEVSPDLMAFFREVYSASFGDDHVINTIDELLEVYSEEHLAVAIAEHFGMKYTREDKLAVGPKRELSEVTFLKRHFRREESGRWVAPLKTEVLDEMVNWVTTNGLRDVPALTAENCETAVREWCLHPKDVYEQKTTELKEACEKKNINIYVPAYSNVRHRVLLGSYMPFMVLALVLVPVQALHNTFLIDTMGVHFRAFFLFLQLLPFLDSTLLLKCIFVWSVYLFAGTPILSILFSLCGFVLGQTIVDEDPKKWLYYKRWVYKVLKFCYVGWCLYALSTVVASHYNAVNCAGKEILTQDGWTCVVPRTNSFWLPRKRVPNSQSKVDQAVSSKPGASGTALYSKDVPVSTEDELIGWEDKAGPERAQIQKMPQPPMCVGLKNDKTHTIKDFLARPKKISSFLWKDTQPAGTELAHFKFPRDLARFAWWREKASFFNYMKGNIKLQLRANGNPHQLGMLIMPVVPEFRDAQASLTHYSIVPNTMFNLEDQVTCVIEMPFIQPYTHVDITNNEGTSIGEMKVVVLSPMRTGSCQVSLWAHFESLELTGPTNVGLDSKLWQVGGEVSGIFEDLASVADGVSNVPVIGALAEPVGAISNMASDLTKALGFSKTTKRDRTRMRVQYAQNAASAGGQSDAKTFTIVEGACLQPLMGFGDLKDEMAVKTIACTPAYVGSFTMSVTDAGDTKLWSTIVSPAAFVAQYREQVALSPLAHAASFFEFWSGGITLTFMPVKNKFQNGSFVISWTMGDPKGKDSDITMAPRRYCDVGATHGCCVTIPFFHNTPVLRTMPTENGQYSNGVVEVRVVNELRVAGTDVPDSVEILVFVNGAKDITFSGPRKPWYLDKQSFPHVVPDDYLQKPNNPFQEGLDGGFLFDAASFRADMRDGQYANPILDCAPGDGICGAQATSMDAVASLKQLCNRYCAIEDSTDHLFFNLPATGTIAANLFSSYLYWRGGQTYMVMPESSKESVLYFFPFPTTAAQIEGLKLYQTAPTQIWIPSMEGPLEFSVHYAGHRAFSRTAIRKGGDHKNGESVPTGQDYDDLTCVYVKPDVTGTVYQACSDDFQLGFYLGCPLFSQIPATDPIAPVCELLLIAIHNHIGGTVKDGFTVAKDKVTINGQPMTHDMVFAQTNGNQGGTASDVFCFGSEFTVNNVHYGAGLYAEKIHGDTYKVQGYIVSEGSLIHEYKNEYVHMNYRGDVYTNHKPGNTIVMTFTQKENVNYKPDLDWPKSALLNGLLGFPIGTTLGGTTPAVGEANYPFTLHNSSGTRTVHYATALKAGNYTQSPAYVRVVRDGRNFTFWLLDNKPVFLFEAMKDDTYRFLYNLQVGGSGHVTYCEGQSVSSRSPYTIKNDVAFMHAWTPADRDWTFF